MFPARTGLKRPLRFAFAKVCRVKSNVSAHFAALWIVKAFVSKSCVVCMVLAPFVLAN